VANTRAPPHTPPARESRRPALRGQARRTSTRPPPGRGVGSVCQAPCWWPWAGAEVSRALYASRGDHESAPAGTGGGAGDLSVARLGPWQPARADDARCRRVHSTVPASYPAHRLPTYPPVWVAREPGPPGEAQGMSGAVPAAVKRHTVCAAEPHGDSSARRTRGGVSRVPARAPGLGRNPPLPAHPLHQVDAAPGLGYFLRGRHDRQTTTLSPEAST